MVQFESLSNFRDMGGVQTRDGKVVKPHCFYRSGALFDASEHDVETLNTLGIKAIIDYRDDNEVVGQPSSKDIQAPIIHIPARKETSVLPTASMEMLTDRSKLDAISLEDFAAFYTELPFDNPVYQKLIQLVANGDTPLLHHCSAGKDRTGVGAALIYLLLNVSEETIIEEYLLTNDYIDATPPNWYQYVVSKVGEHPTLTALARCDRRFIEPMFRAILAKYGDYETYFDKEHHLTKDDIERIRAIYTK